MGYKNKHNAKIIVAAHKEYRMPSDSIYLPVQVGAAGKADIGFTRDDSGDNISELNPEYCELTGLYWAWKNLDADYIGLVHYRRYFKGKGTKDKKLNKSDVFNMVLNSRELDFLLDRYKVILPQKRRYYIESLESHYVHTHSSEELDKTREIIEKEYPDMTEAYEKVMKRTWGYMFNMMIMPKDMVSKYCEWMFSVIDKLRSCIDLSDRSDFEKRYPGRIAELLFNVWIEHRLCIGELSQEDIAELPFVYMEKIDYFHKATSFLAAKFLGKKQTKSF
jgi:hypothetical protein